MILWNTVKTIFFLCLYFHAVAYPRNGNNDIGEIQFFADIAYMHVYGAALAFEIHAPEDVQDLLPCHNAVPVFPKGQEAVKFHRLHGNFYAGFVDGALFLVDGNVLDLDFFCFLAVEAFQDVVNAD